MDTAVVAHMPCDTLCSFSFFNLILLNISHFIFLLSCVNGVIEKEGQSPLFSL